MSLKEIWRSTATPSNSNMQPYLGDDLRLIFHINITNDAQFDCVVKVSTIWIIWFFIYFWFWVLKGYRKTVLSFCAAIIFVNYLWQKDQKTLKYDLVAYQLCFAKISFLLLGESPHQYEQNDIVKNTMVNLMLR